MLPGAAPVRMLPHSGAKHTSTPETGKSAHTGATALTASNCNSNIKPAYPQHTADTVWWCTTSRVESGHLKNKNQEVLNASRKQAQSKELFSLAGSCSVRSVDTESWHRVEGKQEKFLEEATDLFMSVATTEYRRLSKGHLEESVSTSPSKNCLVFYQQLKQFDP